MYTSWAMREVLAESVELDSGVLTESVGICPASAEFAINSLAVLAGVASTRCYCRWARQKVVDSAHTRREGMPCLRVAVFSPGLPASRWRVQASSPRPRKCAD